MKKFKFEQCSLQHVDFEKANLQQVIFKDCDFLRARFEQCNLEGCDFRTSMNIQLDPETNHMKKSKFESEQLPGLLAKYQLLID
ncbi:pentapeptide repeat-containing protein [Sphingobacterium sp. E70]|nr:pentapeptide repeat-containing protein [Sphingobacterium sp. E70]ULT24736.1 pentapeptide repeat-containing protein [Sphingobacterium sp. E70]